MSEFTIKDSGKREEFASGMTRDTEEGKPDFTRPLEGPMFERWAEHLTKGAQKYPDNPNGTANWTNADSRQEWKRFRRSAFRHFVQWLRGDRDEDHAAAVFFNVNAAEFVNDRLEAEEKVELPSSPAELAFYQKLAAQDERRRQHPSGGGYANDVVPFPGWFDRVHCAEEGHEDITF